MAAHIKDAYLIKKIKWYLYKRRMGSPSWKARYFFDQKVRKLKPGDIAVDCGANVGLITRKLARRGAIVHAFEPDPYSFSRLKEAVSSYPNVVLHNAAVGISADKIRLYRTEEFDVNPEHSSLSSSIYGDKSNVSKDNFVVVDQINFLDFLNNIPGRISILKMDIEGAEVPIIEKFLDSALMDKIGSMFVETHDSRIPQLVQRTDAIRRIVAERFPDKVNLDWV